MIAQTLHGAVVGAIGLDRAVCSDFWRENPIGCGGQDNDGARETDTGA